MNETQLKNVLNEQAERGISFKFIAENCKTIGDLIKLEGEFLGSHSRNKEKPTNA